MPSQDIYKFWDSNTVYKWDPCFRNSYFAIQWFLIVFFWESHFCIEYIPIRILEDLLFYSCSRKPTITRDQKTDRARVRCLGWVDLASFLSFHISSAKKKSELICTASFLIFRGFCATKSDLCVANQKFFLEWKCHGPAALIGPSNSFYYENVRWGPEKTHYINVKVHTNSGRICPSNHSWWSHIVYMLLKTIGWLKLSFRNWAILSMFIPFCKLFTRKRKMVFSWCCFLLKEKMPSPFLLQSGCGSFPSALPSETRWP